MIDLRIEGGKQKKQDSSSVHIQESEIYSVECSIYLEESVQMVIRLKCIFNKHAHTHTHTVRGKTTKRKGAGVCVRVRLGF